MDSNIVALQGPVLSFRTKLEGLADSANILYALYRLAEAQPDSFDSYRQLAMSDTGEGDLRLKFVLRSWPGRATASALQRGAEKLLSELNHHPIADGAVLCAKTLLDNLRIVGGLYVSVNQRDPVTFRRRADQRLVDHWLNAVCESQVEYLEVVETLRVCAAPRTSRPSEAVGSCVQP
jgi:hypothetical protein